MQEDNLSSGLRYCYTLLMKIYYISSGTLFALVAVFSFLSRKEGWYNMYWYTDVILHFVSGVALGIMWVALTKKDLGTSQTPYTWILFFIGVVSFAVFWKCIMGILGIRWLAYYPLPHTILYSTTRRYSL